MNKILILYPHFPPSNLAGVHRPRLFAQHLPSFDWEPIILTVHEKFYEEALDYNLAKLLPVGLRIEKVKAFNITKPRLVGDIGLRSFFQLYKKAKNLIKSEKIDFLYIPVPSFYCALLGRWLNYTTNILYGIDYIDPWVHYFPGSDKVFSRHWFSTQVAKLLEPIAVKNASLITGVAEGYFSPVFQRNPKLKSVYGSMPYGGEEMDHQLVEKLSIKPYLFEKKRSKIQLVYAGAILPKAYKILDLIFKSLKGNQALSSEIEFYFIGTGSTANDPLGFTVKPIADKYNLWQQNVFEFPARIPYLDVLVHLQHADGVFILGSTEPHYTPSKVYQGVLSKKPVFAVLHRESSAVSLLKKSGAGIVLTFNGEVDLVTVENDFCEELAKYILFLKQYNPFNIDKDSFENYTAKSVTKQLVHLLNKATNTYNRNI